MRDQFIEKMAALTPADAAGWMGAFLHHGSKRNAGKTHEIVMDFAKQFVWTAAMVKGLVAGIADSKDGEQAEKAMQTLVDCIADEYSIFPAKEYLEEAA